MIIYLLFKLFRKQVKRLGKRIIAVSDLGNSAVIWYGKIYLSLVL